MGTSISGYGTGGYGVGGYGENAYGNAPVELLPVGYYLALFTSQYQGSANLQAFASALFNLLEDAMACLASMDQAFDLDYAVGVQLDALGQVIGQSRIVGFQPSNGVSATLDDPTYQTLLKARVAQNHWNGSADGLQAIWANLFPGGSILIEDQQNMTANIYLTGVFSSITQDLITNGYIVPRPETVLYAYYFPTLPVFGFDQNNAYVAGFDLGHLA